MTKNKPAQGYNSFFSNEILAKAIIEQSGEGLSLADTDGNYVFINPALCEITGYSETELLTMNIRDLTLPGTEMELLQSVLKKQKGKREVELLKKDGSHFFAEILGFPIKMENQVFALGVIHDITKRKKAEEALKNAYNELEKKVAERTKELKVQKERLEEMNAALKVLLEHREEERKEFVKNILLNTEKMILPYIDKLYSTLRNENTKNYLKIIKANIKDLVSPFVGTLLLKQLHLTPTEMQISDFIRNGLSNKEISNQLNVTVDAISFHRKNIRKKLGLTNKKINLRTYLLNLAD